MHCTQLHVVNVGEKKVKEGKETLDGKQTAALLSIKIHLSAS